jgi:integrase
MKKLPKHQRGIHIFCTTCSNLCSKEDRRCKKSPHILAKNCEGNKKYQSRIWNPLTQRTDKIKTWDKDNLQEVMKLHSEFKDVLKASNFNHKEVVDPRPVKLVECMEMYLDWMQDIDVPEHEKKNLSIRHIKRAALMLKAFIDIVGKDKLVRNVSAHDVGSFHDYLLHDRKFKPETYNKYMGTLKALFHYLNNQKKYGIDNPFQDVKKKYVAVDVKIITEEEFDKLISVITPENGMRQIASRKEGRNLYFDWLVKAFKLARLTGARREELMVLSWEHVEDNYIRIPNIKISKMKKVDTGSIVPITQDLAELLADCRGDGYLIAPDHKNRDTLVNYLTTCFRHFWDVAELRPGMKFSHLRKTYITRINVLLGEKAQLLGNHKSLDIQIKHYIGKQEIQKQLLNTRLF